MRISDWSSDVCSSDLGPLWQVVRGSGVEASEAARVVGAPVLTAMPDQRGLDESIDLGKGPLKSKRCVLARAALDVLESCGPEAVRSDSAAACVLRCPSRPDWSTSYAPGLRSEERWGGKKCGSTC